MRWARLNPMRAASLSGYRPHECRLFAGWQVSPTFQKRQPANPADAPNDEEFHSRASRDSQTFFPSQTPPDGSPEESQRETQGS